MFATVRDARPPCLLTCPNMESGDFMPRIMRLLAVSAFATVTSMTAVQAQDALQNDHGTMVVGGMEISVGAGVATLDLPDVRFGVLSQNSSTGGINTVRTFTNDNNFDHEFGPSGARHGGSDRNHVSRFRFRHHRENEARRR